MTLFHAGTGMLLRTAIAPMRTHDHAQASRMHGALAPGDVVLADRGFSSFSHMVMLWQAGMLAVFRAHQRQIVMPDRISFVDALRWLVAAGTGLPLRRIRMLPLRPDRHEPRVRKRRPKNYPLMTKPRAELMQALSGQRLKASLRAIRAWHRFFLVAGTVFRFLPGQ